MSGRPVAPEDDSSGAAYVFQRDSDGDSWEQDTKLTVASPDGAFGYSVAVSGDICIIGDYSSSEFGLGSAYLFERNRGGPGNWGQVIRLIADDAAAGDRFGFIVAVDSDTAIVGAYRDDDTAIDSGSAYIFERNHGGIDNWGQAAKLTADDAAAVDTFGYNVMLSGDYAIVGAPYSDDAGSESGSAYVFERNQGGPGNWGQVAKLTADDAAAGDRFGWRVAISGDTVIIGAYRDDDAGSNSGAAYIFERGQDGSGSWGQIAKLTADDAAADDNFGVSVAASYDTAIIGAYGSDDNGSESGSAYVFKRDEGGPSSWGQVAKLTAADAGTEDRFGYSVSISEATAIVGAYWDDDAGSESGSAYIFQSTILFEDGFESGDTSRWSSTVPPLEGLYR